MQFIHTFIGSFIYLTNTVVSASYVLNTSLDTGEFAVKKDKNFCLLVHYNAGWMGMEGKDKLSTSVNNIHCM